MRFDELLKKIGPTLRRITYKLNHYYTYFNDEDLYQEALVHLWNNLKAGTLDDKTESYVLQGCYFHLRNYIRTHKAKAVSISLDPLAFDESAGLQDVLFLEDVASARYIDDLHIKLLAETIRNNGLTDREKYVLSLYSEGLVTRDIGKRLGISHVSVLKLTKIIRGKCLKYRDGCFL